MFAELYIENLALIEKTALLWQPGLNVLSGETGAGKSMLYRCCWAAEPARSRCGVGRSVVGCRVCFCRLFLQPCARN